MMKRRKLTTTKMTKSKSSDSGSLNSEAIERPMPAVDESTQVRPGVVVVDGCEVPVRNGGEEGSGSLPPRVAELSLNETKDKVHDVDFNDRFPDEILLSIFKYIWRPAHYWEAAKVCKRWYILLARNQLQKRSNHEAGRYPCTGSKRKNRSGEGNPPRCNGSSHTLKLTKIDSEWKLSKDLLKSCRRHTSTLEIKDCTHVSVRGYQLIAAFVSNLKAIRLEACSSMDDPSLDVILDRCSSLRSIHLTMVPKLTLKNLEKKARLLQELHVYGCPSVTSTTVFSLLNGCPNLRTLCLSAVGISHDWKESKILQGPPFRLQCLKLSNTSAVTDGFLQALAERLTNLRILSLSHCPQLSDDCIRQMNYVCVSGLQRLVVTWCPGIADETIRAFAPVVANLQDLSLAGTNVSDEGIEALIGDDTVASTLRNLCVACCQRVTDAGLQHFVARQDQLVRFKTLDLQNCPGVSIFALKTLRNSITEIPLKIVSDKGSVTVSE
ncbi:unnamed protein product [Calypogeia fissa]